MPTVSVIIPTYNRAAMVKEAVESVLDQTYTDYEIIVVDDGSTDNTREMMAGLSNKVTYVYQPNRGSSSARNHGIRLAGGKYIAFLDSDDLFLPTKLEKQVALMEGNPGVLLSHTSYERVNAKGEHIEMITSGTFAGYVYPKFLSKCPIAAPTVMVRREGLGEKLRFEESISVGEDIILWAQLARKSIVLGINEALTKVRIHGGSAALDPDAQIIGLMNIMEYAVRREPDLSPMLRRGLLSDGYLVIGYNHLRKHELSQCLRFLCLAVWAHPLSVLCRLPMLSYSQCMARRRRLPRSPRETE